MKIENLNKYIMASLCFTLLLSSCEISGEQGPDNEESATWGLCRYWWRVDYLDYDNATIRQQFIFGVDGTGSEIISRSKLGQTTSQEYFFKWYWTSDTYRTICLEYGENDVVFMDRVFIADNVFTCFMTGVDMVFYGRQPSY